MTRRNEPAIIFADVQQDIPQYLCIDRHGLYICTVGQQAGEFVEQDIQRVDMIGAKIFMASAFNRAMCSIGGDSTAGE